MFYFIVRGTKTERKKWRGSTVSGDLGVLAPGWGRFPGDAEVIFLYDKGDARIGCRSRFSIHELKD